MSVQLKLDEMLEVLKDAHHPMATQFEMGLCQLGDAMAYIISEIHDCEAGRATMEGVAFGGICAPFKPRWEDQQIPEIFEALDPGGAPDWKDQAAFECPEKADA